LDSGINVSSDDIVYVNNIQSHKVDVQVKKIGGGFDGERARETILSNSGIVVSLKLKRIIIIFLQLDVFILSLEFIIQLTQNTKSDLLRRDC
jgi:hypothetical protein